MRKKQESTAIQICQALLYLACISGVGAILLLILQLLLTGSALLTGLDVLLPERLVMIAACLGAVWGFCLSLSRLRGRPWKWQHQLLAAIVTFAFGTWLWLMSDEVIEYSFTRWIVLPAATQNALHVLMSAAQRVGQKKV